MDSGLTIQRCISFIKNTIMDFGQRGITYAELKKLAQNYGFSDGVFESAFVILRKNEGRNIHSWQEVVGEQIIRIYSYFPHTEKELEVTDDEKLDYIIAKYAGRFVDSFKNQKRFLEDIKYFLEQLKQNPKTTILKYAINVLFKSSGTAEIAALKLISSIIVDEKAAEKIIAYQSFKLSNKFEEALKKIQDEKS